MHLLKETRSIPNPIHIHCDSRTKCLPRTRLSPRLCRGFCLFTLTICPVKLFGRVDCFFHCCLCSCQHAVLNELELGPNIARNTALSENVFMMVVCIELRIPLFVVGKPGSSKSLAKTVVADNMQGDAAKSQLFKSFKQVRTENVC